LIRFARNDVTICNTTLLRGVKRESNPWKWKNNFQFKKVGSMSFPRKKITKKIVNCQLSIVNSKKYWKLFLLCFCGLLRFARNDVTICNTTLLRGVKRESNPWKWKNNFQFKKVGSMSFPRKKITKKIVNCQLSIVNSKKYCIFAFQNIKKSFF